MTEREQAYEQARKLDKQIAEKVMGCPAEWCRWSPVPLPTCGCPDNRHNIESEAYVGLPFYSTDMDAAMRVVLKMPSLGFSWSLTGVPRQSSVQPGIYVAFQRSVYPPSPGHYEPSAVIEDVPTGDDHEARLATAICRAALRAVEAGESK